MGDDRYIFKAPFSHELRKIILVRDYAKKSEDVEIFLSSVQKNNQT